MSGEVDGKVVEHQFDRCKYGENYSAARGQDAGVVSQDGWIQVATHYETLRKGAAEVCGYAGSAKAIAVEFVKN